MKYSGLYLVSNPSNTLDAALNTVNNLVQGIETNLQTAARQSPWSLQYRLFRDATPPGYTPSTSADGKPKPFAHKLQHLLHLSSLDPARTYIFTQPPTGTGSVSSIPLRQQESHAILVRNQFASLWQPRNALSLPQGISYTAGLCTVQIGELRASREGMQSGGIQSPGVLVCISTAVGADNLDDASDAVMDPMYSEENAIDFEYAQAVIRDCWSRIRENRDLGKSEVREVMMAQDNVTGAKETAVRMWCEVLRLRA